MYRAAAVKAGFVSEAVLVVAPRVPQTSPQRSDLSAMLTRSETGSGCERDYKTCGWRTPPVVQTSTRATPT